MFELPFMRSVKGLSRGTFSSDSATVEIVPLVQEASSATLRDIKEPVPRRGPGAVELLLGLAALAAAGWLAWRARRRALPSVPASPLPAEAPPEPRDPYEIALDRLAVVEDAGWAAADVARHYEAVADALRDYLEAYGVPARERTTAELRWALPPALLAGGARRRFEQVFEDADLVKFAHWRPGADAAGAFLGVARALLVRWQAVEAAERVGRGNRREPSERAQDDLAAPLLAVLAAAPVRAQTLEVVPDTGRLTVGDPIGLRLVLRQYEGDALLEQVPHPEATLGDGVRLLAVDSMRRIATRVLEAHASIAFYRPGSQTIPPSPSISAAVP